MTNRFANRFAKRFAKICIAAHIASKWRLAAVAAPDYFSQHPVPQTPQDLFQHNCINQARSGGLHAWEFAWDERSCGYASTGQLRFNTTLPMIDAVLSGLGIAYVPENLVTGHIRSGGLCRCSTTARLCSRAIGSTTRAAGRTRRHFVV
ncbi:LysR substrate-binding domain-containing protein [Sinorhizobium sp. 6-70]|uniref:LysR substrate-binding domain-containing protein n=1 Tax=Sinorhizobium sp. 6-70 TaxID=3049088 RepID=UPI0034DE34EC